MRQVNDAEQTEAEGHPGGKDEQYSVGAVDCLHQPECHGLTAAKCLRWEKRRKKHARGRDGRSAVRQCDRALVSGSPVLVFGSLWVVRRMSTRMRCPGMKRLLIGPTSIVIAYLRLHEFLAIEAVAETHAQHAIGGFMAKPSG